MSSNETGVNQSCSYYMQMKPAPSLTKASLEAVTAGKELAARLAAAAHHRHCGRGRQQPQQSLASTGARLLAVSGEAFAQARYATDAAACEALCRAAQATIVLAPGSSRFARVAAGVAHRLGGFIDTHITAVGGAESVEAIALVLSPAHRSRSQPRRSAPGSCCSTPARTRLCGQSGDLPQSKQVPVELPALRTTVTGFRAPAQDAQTIRPDAKLLFVAGAGWTKKQPDGQVHADEAGELILGFLRASGASLGSSKSLVDQGGDGQPVLPFLTHMNQIGQTGATPRHAKGLSTCCHGEEPHVVGWRFIGERRAISLDPNCGWTRGKADVVYIADAFQVMARVNALAGCNESVTSESVASPPFADRSRAAGCGHGRTFPRERNGMAAARLFRDIRAFISELKFMW